MKKNLRHTKYVYRGTYSSVRGFTLLELLLSVALISLLAGFSVPVYQRAQVNRTAETERDQVVLLLRRAQTLARSGYYDNAWGVSVATSSAVLFRGENFDVRDTDFDEVIPFSNMVNDDPLAITFEKDTGQPSTTHSFVFTTTGDYELALTLHEEGVVSW